MKLYAALLILALAQPALAQAPKDPPAAAKPSKLTIPPAIQAALDAPDRAMEARLRDEQRHVVDILKATDAAPGYRVLDIASGSGYLALLLSTMVGDKGHVDIHNTPGWINQFPSMDPEALQRRIKRSNIGYITAPWNDIPIQKNAYDLIIMGEVYHDVIVEGGDWQGLDRQIFDMLKPGGRLVVEDHDANPEMYLMQQANLHRISHGDVEGHFLKAGFKLESMQLFDSKYDDEKMNVFYPGVRGRTDKFIAAFVKPKS
jgi:predicted methyltransferase